MRALEALRAGRPTFRWRILLAGIGLVGGVAALLWSRFEGPGIHYTGFVEGEERILRSEVAARVREVRFGEGDAIPAGAVVAVLDDAETRARIAAKTAEIAVLEAEIAAQEERIRLVEDTWAPGKAAEAAGVRRAEAAALLAEKNLERQRRLVESGATTEQRLDEARSARDQARGALRQARERLARAEAEERRIALARRELETLRRRRELLGRQLEELEIQRAKHEIRAPDSPTVVQSQLLWPGEFAQPGTPVLAVIDPADKFVQIYLPAADLPRVPVGTRVEIELDARPGERLPGEVIFVADRAAFTPEKIETRDDRLGQVYRAKVRILQHPERLPLGAEGNVYLVSPTPERGANP